MDNPFVAIDKGPYMALVYPLMNDSNLYDFVMRCLTTLRYTRKQVAAGSGVPFSTVCKVAQRSVTEPSVHTIQAMADFFRRELARQEQPAMEPHPGGRPLIGPAQAFPTIPAPQGAKEQEAA